MIHLQRSTIAGLQATQPAVQDVCNSLQQAVRLEHATIPLYLYALYSLDITKNREIADILQSVVIEEMLHMTLSSNVLNALGGSPNIDKQGFIPTYPGPLPGGVDSCLTVNLAPFSMTQLKTFLAIEEPETPLQYKTRMANTGPQVDSITIGEFYTAISAAIARLGDGAFVKPPRNQVGPDLMRGAVVVTSVASAQQAITTIIKQGEGTATSPEEIVGTDYAHCYRYMQIQKGFFLVPVPNPPTPQQAYAYAGAPIPFDPTGVHALPINPALTPYPAGSAQAFANNNFNYTYTGLLGALHALMNGCATQAQMNVAISLMMSLKGQAKAMTSGIPDAGVLTGPSFEYLPVNP